MQVHFYRKGKKKVNILLKNLWISSVDVESSIANIIYPE